MNVNKLIDSFIKKILENNSSSLEEKMNQINTLLDNLIDYCIKKKIYYYIENNVKYSQIMNSFKNNLCIFIQKLIDPDNTIISKYIDDYNNENYDNFSDINSLLLNKFKVGNNKNKVIFRDNLSIINDSEDIQFNNNNNSMYIIESSHNDDYINKLPIYIKILITQDKYIIEFIEKLNIMCDIISNTEIIYNKNNPFS